MPNSPQDPKVPPKFFQTQDFKALDTEWRKKLKDSGFEDIERPDGNLKDGASSSNFKKRPEYDQSKAEYYRLAGQFLHEWPSPFRTSKSGTGEWKKRIWELHANGKSIREIIKIVDPEGKEAFGTMFHKIRTTLARLAKVMVAKCQKQFNQ